jgi:hypothetical protein
MGRQFRAPRRGNSVKFNTVQVPASSSTVIAIPNYGITDVSTFAAGEYVLDAPEEGVRKTLVNVSGTSAARIIRSATDGAVKFGNALTSIVYGGTTVDTCIVLVGINSTRWCVESVYPVAATAAGVTLST